MIKQYIYKIYSMPDGDKCLEVKSCRHKESEDQRENLMSKREPRKTSVLIDI